MVSTKQLQDAREFLHEVLVDWNHSVLDPQQMAALPHFEILLDALTPVEVKDAHLERAKEVEQDILSTSPAAPGQPHPPGHALKIMAQAIASAEARGEQRAREQA